MSPVVIAVAVVTLMLLGFGQFAYANWYGPRARLKRRIDAVVGKPARVAESGKRDGTNVRRRMIQSRVKEIESGRSKSGRKQALRRQIQQAGLDLTPQQLLMIAIGTGVASGGVALVSGLPSVIVLLAIPIGGLGLPRFWLSYMAAKRQNQFTHHFADALDVIVRGIKSGLPVGECLRIIGRESPEPVGGEFRQIIEGQRIGLTLDESLARAFERMPTRELQFFSIVLMIQRQTGGNLAETLANLSNVLRARKRLRDKIAAMSAEAKASSMIIGSLPPGVGLILMLVNPDYVSILLDTRSGNVLIGIGAGWMLLGVLVMKKMINFKS